MDMLTLSNVTKSFGGKKVLNNLSFSVPRNSIFGFVGPNGAGKTTTMKIILGLLAADSGEISVNGEQVHYGKTNTNRFIGYLPDVPEFYSYMTPLEYLIFCGKITNMKTEDARRRAEELLNLVGLQDENRRIKGFSRGMKQRLGIAQALLNKPQLLICDEPTSALDPIGRKEILDILLSARKETTILFSTHILPDVERICDEIAFLHNGQIALHGTLDEIKAKHSASAFEIELENPQDSELLLSQFGGAHLTESNHLLFEKINQSQLEDILSFIVEKHISVVRIEKQEPSLESLFMEVMKQ